MVLTAQAPKLRAAAAGPSADGATEVGSSLAPTVHHPPTRR